MKCIKTLVSSALSVSFRFLDLRVKMVEILAFIYMIRWSIHFTVCPTHKDYVESREILVINYGQQLISVGFKFQTLSVKLVHEKMFVLFI